jgi:hypothetical protein
MIKAEGKREGVSALAFFVSQTQTLTVALFLFAYIEVKTTPGWKPYQTVVFGKQKK